MELPLAAGLGIEFGLSDVAAVAFSGNMSFVVGHADDQIMIKLVPVYPFKSIKMLDRRIDLNKD